LERAIASGPELDPTAVFAIGKILNLIGPGIATVEEKDVQEKNHDDGARGLTNSSHRISHCGPNWIPHRVTFVPSGSPHFK
jgi:hypothetical protein